MEVTCACIKNILRCKQPTVLRTGSLTANTHYTNPLGSRGFHYKTIYSLRWQSNSISSILACHHRTQQRHKGQEKKLKIKPACIGGGHTGTWHSLKVLKTEEVFRGFNRVEVGETNPQESNYMPQEVAELKPLDTWHNFSNVLAAAHQKGVNLTVMLFIINIFFNLVITVLAPARIFFSHPLLSTRI